MDSVLFIGNFLSKVRGHRHYCEDLADRVEGSGWRVVRTSDRPARVSKLVDMVRSTWTRRHDYSVAHVDLYSGSAFAWAEVVCLELRRLHKPFILTMHGGNLPSFARRWPRRTRRLLAAADLVTAPSEYLREEMRAHVRDVEVVPNGIDLARYPFSVRSAPKPRLVWLRAFHRAYNPTLAIDVLAQLRTRHPEVTLRMFGPDREDGSLDEVRQRARALGVEAHVELCGAIANRDVPQALAQGDVLLNTTNVDNTPVSVLEAMACGLCVVSTNVGGLPHMLDDGRDALLVPPADPRAMAAAVSRLFDEPGLAARLSENARQRAAACDWPRVVGRWDTLLRSVTARA